MPVPACAMTPESEVARLRGLVEPVVVTTVHVTDRRGDELRRLQIVEARHVDRNVVATDLPAAAAAAIGLECHAGMPRTSG